VAVCAPEAAYRHSIDSESAVDAVRRTGLALPRPVEIVRLLARGTNRLRPTQRASDTAKRTPVGREQEVAFAANRAHLVHAAPRASIETPKAVSVRESRARRTGETVAAAAAGEAFGAALLARASVLKKPLHAARAEPADVAAAAGG